MPSGLAVRSLSSVVVVIAAAIIVFAPALLVALVLLALAGVGVSEMYQLLGREGLPLDPTVGTILALLIVLASVAGLRSLLAGYVLLDLSVFVALVLPPAVAMLRGPRMGGLVTWGLSSLGALYVAWPLAHVELLRSVDHGRGWLAFAILCTWATDTGAYLVGSQFGRHRLVPRISPGKTVEGAVGALVLTGIVGWITGYIADLPLPYLWIVVVALVLSVLAQLGDITESYIKRVAGVKDSGDLIPGHGGLLDRIDGFLWVIVATFYIAVIVL